MHTGHAMAALVVENSKVIVLCLWICTMIVMSHFGRKSRQPGTSE